MSSAAQRLVEAKTEASAAPAIVKHSLLSDYAQLFKVRVSSLVVMTAWTGFYMGAAKSSVSSVSWVLFHALLGVGLTCAGSAALNEVLERRIDALMRRTKNRPLPSGRMSVTAGLIAGLAATLCGSAYFAPTTNVLTGALALGTAVTYLAFYT